MLDIEQIGHVYEGLLDHTARRMSGWFLKGRKAPVNSASVVSNK
jgi:hypothetical protein